MINLNWVDGQRPFKHGEYEHRALPGGGFITWDEGEVVAVSPPNIGPLDAITFWRIVELLLPNGWASDPEVIILSDGCIAIKGEGD